MYISFFYKEIKYCGLAIQIIFERTQPYLFYVDTNLFPRITKVRHLKKIKDVNNNEISEENLIKSLKQINYDGKLFSFEGTKFLDPIKKSINTQIEYLRVERDKSENFKLEDFDNKLQFKN